MPRKISLKHLTGITMLQKTTQWIMDRLVERAVPSIGSFMASALQRMLILGHAEHHNQLEEQARRYESAGKPHLAKLIRNEAEQMTLNDPFSTATSICQGLTDESQDSSTLPVALIESVPAKKKNKSRRSTSEKTKSEAQE